jgi:hypothetical protein
VNRTRLAANRIPTNTARAFNVGSKLGALERGRWADLSSYKGIRSTTFATRNTRVVNESR